MLGRKNVPKMTTPISCMAAMNPGRQTDHHSEQQGGDRLDSYSHTGVPVQTSALGVGADLFNGYYDQTDIYTKMAKISGLKN